MKMPNGVNRKFKCPKCGETKTSRLFPKNKSTKSGYDSWCKACQKVRMKDYFQRKRLAPINRAKFAQFMAQVVQGEGECHEWTGYRNVEDGRPMFHDKGTRRAARWICEYFWGPAPIDEDGKPYVAHHLCGNGAECVAPHHIRWVSDAQHRELHAEERRLEKEAV